MAVHRFFWSVNDATIDRNIDGNHQIVQSSLRRGSPPGVSDMATDIRTLYYGANM